MNVLSLADPRIFDRIWSIEADESGMDGGQRQDSPVSPPEELTGPAESQLKSPSRVRTNFPETWIWADEIIE